MYYWHDLEFGSDVYSVGLTLVAMSIELSRIAVSGGALAFGYGFLGRRGEKKSGYILGELLDEVSWQEVQLIPN